MMENINNELIIKEIEDKYRYILKAEYEKRDNLEKKFLVVQRRVYEFEQALFATQDQLKISEEKNRNYLLELQYYRRSKLIRILYRFSRWMLPLQERYGGRSSWRLLKKRKEYWAAVFNVRDYCSYNPDIYEAIGNNEKQLLSHFIREGMKEGRIASANFDVYAYRAYNPDVVEVCGNELKNTYIHYIECGKHERRRCTWMEN